MTNPMTDRDRLAAAFAELRDRGYVAPIEWAWEMCCQGCGHHAAAKQGAERWVFWHSQMDDGAFFKDPYGDDWFPIDEESLPTAGESARELAWRLDHSMLVRDLSLYWRGTSADVFEAVGVLCEHGLDAWWDGDERRAIVVRSGGK